MPGTPKKPTELDQMRTALGKLLSVVEKDYKDLAEKAVNLADLATKLDKAILVENNKIGKDSKKALLINALDELFMTSSGNQLRNGQAQALIGFLEPALSFIETKIKLYNLQNEQLKQKLKSGKTLHKSMQTQRKLK